MNLSDSTDPDESPDAWAKYHWAQVPETIRKDVERHVQAHLPPELVESLRDSHRRGASISLDTGFFHFGAGLAVRNICRERLSDRALATYGFGCDWDNCYIGVLAAIAADLAEGT